MVSEEIGLSALIDGVMEHLDRHLSLDLQYDGVCATTLGGLKTWYEVGNTTMIVNAPLDGWGEAGIIPNLLGCLENRMVEDNDEIVSQLSISKEDWEELGLTFTLKELISNDNPMIRGLAERPIYIMLKRSMTDFTREQQRAIVEYQSILAISLMAMILEKTDLKPKSKPSLKS